MKRGLVYSLALVLLGTAAGSFAVGTEAREAQSTESEPSAAPAFAEPLGLPNEKQPLAGILTGGQPTPEMLGVASRAGYQAVLNLRGPNELEGWEEKELTERLGMRYLALPIAGAEDFTRENAAAFANWVNDDELHPLLVHCGSGNRVGALFALKAFYVDGAEVDAAMEIGRSAGLTSLEPAVLETLRTASVP